MAGKTDDHDDPCETKLSDISCHGDMGDVAGTHEGKDRGPTVPGDGCSGHVGGDSFEGLPVRTCLCQWNESYAADLNVTYKMEPWREFMKNNAHFDFDGSRWSRLVRVFKILMNTVPLDITASQSSRVRKILTRPDPLFVLDQGQGCSSSTSSRFKPAGSTTPRAGAVGASATAGDVTNQMNLDLMHIYCSITRARQMLRVEETRKVMAERTRIVPQLAESSIRMFTESVGVFFDELLWMLLKLQNGVPPTESAFQNLFQAFARIFKLSFRPGSVQPARQTTIFGQMLTSQPDLRCEQFGRTGSLSAVVSVAKVKKHSPKRKLSPTGSKPRSACKTEKAPAVTTTATTSSPPLKRKKMDDDADDDDDDDANDDDDVVYDHDDLDVTHSHNVKGRHAAELLLELPYSVIEVRHGKMCVVGLIIQATKVRLTCLEIDVDHYNQLSQPQFTPLEQNRQARIYYSKGYDMLVKGDWEHLAEIMITLGSFGDDLRIPLLDSLTPFLPQE